MDKNRHEEAMLIPALLADALSMRDKVKLKRHLKTCLECKQTLNELSSVSDNLPAAAAGNISPPSSLRDKILTQAEDTKQRQTLPSEAAGKVIDGANVAIESPVARKTALTLFILGVLYFITRHKRNR